jgi:hypothetical protein
VLPQFKKKKRKKEKQHGNQDSFHSVYKQNKKGADAQCQHYPFPKVKDS